MNAQLKSGDALQLHIAGSYHNLRLGIAVLGAILPFLLWLRDQFPMPEVLRGSISVYYYSLGSRDILVGTLCAVGLFLYLYKGFSTAENVALNFAGVFLILVAVVPTTNPEAGRPFQITPHALFAVLFFVCISYVSIFRSGDTLSLIRSTRNARFYWHLYRLTGACMLLSPIIAIVVARIFRPESLIFFIEAFGVVAFAVYWFAKTFEIRSSNADRLAMAGQLEALTPVQRQSSIGGFLQVGPTGPESEWDPRVIIRDEKLASGV